MQYKRSVIASASEDRLERLIRERLSPGADREAVDRRIWDLFGEEWSIMFTDLSGFSRKVEKFGITHFLQTIFEAERILIPVIEAFDGILLKVEGDSFLVMFRSAVKAARCAVKMQKELEVYNADKADEDKVLLCVGLGHGLVLRIGDVDVFGQEVNSASKLGEDSAKAGEILVTGGLLDKLGEASKEWRFDEFTELPSGIKRAYYLRY